MKKLLKFAIPVCLVAAVAVPASAVLLAPQGEPTPVVQAADAPQDADPLAALMAGNVVGRRGCLFGRRLPTSFFLP